ncbi:helix-turn-helix domain-containing protein [Pediococcus pentosaceus]|uniref:helix-turn-helix domain-containing protein n=1 Tax=Pediococcus pentosaceus TaxID=1255 RepID=UPI0034637140
MNEDKPNYYSITPANVRYDKSLPMGARFMYGEITALTKKDGYCWAGDSYFAELYEVTNTTIQNWLRALERKGYISRKRIYKEGTKQIKNRYIRLFDTPTQNNLGTYVKNINDPTQNNLGTYPKNIKNPTQNNLRDSITSTITSTTTNNNKPSKPPKPVADRDHFESLWKLYPNKKAKNQHGIPTNNRLKMVLLTMKLSKALTITLQKSKLSRRQNAISSTARRGLNKKDGRMSTILLRKLL